MEHRYSESLEEGEATIIAKVDTSLRRRCNCNHLEFLSGTAKIAKVD